MEKKEEGLLKKVLKIFVKILWGILALFVFFLVAFPFIIFVDLCVHLFAPNPLEFYKNPPSWYFLWKSVWTIIGSIVGIICASFIFFKKVIKIEKLSRKILIILVFIAFLILFRIFFPAFTFRGNELEPYLKNGQTFLIQKFDKSIKRGDIVMFSDGKMGMIFGLPEEKVEIKEGVIFINDQPLKEINYNLGKLSSHQSITVPEDSFFCFLPNPKNKDWIDLSFYICKKSEIKGKVFLKF